MFLTRSTSSPARRRVSTVALAAALTAGVAATGSLTAAPAEAAGSVDLPALRPAVQHPGAPGRLKLAKGAQQGTACSFLVLRRHRIFQVHDHCIGPTGQRLGDALGAAGRQRSAARL